MRALDITGERYGRLVAIERGEPICGRRKRTGWRFRCDCGETVNASLEAVRRGLTRSCGCLQIETTRARSLTHGHRVGYSTSRTLKSWEHAKSRCLNPNDEKFPSYGARGITMCARWANDFAAFLADMGECPPGMTIDRLDNDGAYEPGNCRWATPAIQNRNTRQNVLVEHDGRTMVLKDFAAAVGVSYKQLHRRFRQEGQPLAEAVQSLQSIRPRHVPIP